MCVTYIVIENNTWTETGRDTNLHQKMSKVSRLYLYFWANSEYIKTVPSWLPRQLSLWHLVSSLASSYPGSFGHGEESGYEAISSPDQIFHVLLLVQCIIKTAHICIPKLALQSCTMDTWLLPGAVHMILLLCTLSTCMAQIFAGANLSTPLWARS